MRQQIDLTSGALKVFLFTLTFSGLSGGHVQSDSTFFPDGTPEAETNSVDKEGSDAIKEWAELKPSVKKTAELLPPKQDEPKQLAQPQPPALEKQEGEAQQTVPSLGATTDSKTSADTQEKQPLQLSTVKPHPTAIPVAEKDQASASQKAQNGSPKTVLSYENAANNRTPVGILDPKQEIHTQRWYIYSSAIRGLKSPSDSVHIVSMEGVAPTRGEEIKSLLVEMGIEPEKIQLVHAKGEKNQTGVVYIFAGQ